MNRAGFARTKREEKYMSKKMKKIMIIAGIIIVVMLVQWLFIGYRFSFGPFKALGDIRMGKLPGNADSYNMDTVEPLEDNPLKGKNVLFLGSSVTYGSASLRQGIPEYFAARFGCSSTKEAVSGTTLVDNGASSYVQRLINNTDPNASYDLMICQLSTNDASKKLPLGEIAEGKTLDSFDTSTVTGAMEYIICYAQQTWGCKVAFYTGSKYDSAPYGAMVERVLALKEKWGIQVLDLWSSDDFNALSDADRAIYMNDNIHPTKAGYRDWWCPELERQVLAWLAEE